MLCLKNKSCFNKLSLYSSNQNQVKTSERTDFSNENS